VEVVVVLLFGGLSYSGDACGPSGGWGGGSFGVDCPDSRPPGTILAKNVFFWIACVVFVGLFLTVVRLLLVSDKKSRK